MRVWDGCKSAAFVLRFATRLGLHARCMNFSTRLALHAVIMLYHIHTRSGKWKADLAGGIARSVKNFNEIPLVAEKYPEDVKKRVNQEYSHYSV